MKVPPDLQSLVSLKEIRYSLRTGFQGEAKFRARIMAAFIQRLFRGLRKDRRMRELSAEENRRLIHQYFSDCLERDETSRVMEDDPLPDEVHEEELMGYESVIDFWKKDLADCNYQNAAKIVDRLLMKNKLALPPESLAYRTLCREILKTDVRIFKILKKREVGDYSYEETTPPSAA
jgi:hypothetical protein